MSKETRIQVIPGVMPDGREFVTREPLTSKVIALGTLQEHGENDDSGLASELMGVGGVCGLKLEDNTALVIIRDPGDWDAIEPTVLKVIEEFLDGVRAAPDEKETTSGIRITLGDNEPAMRIYEAPKSLVSGGLAKNAAAAGEFNPRVTSYKSALSDGLNDIVGVRGVLLEENRASVVINIPEDWWTVEPYVLKLLEDFLKTEDEPSEDNAEPYASDVWAQVGDYSVRPGRHKDNIRRRTFEITTDLGSEENWGTLAGKSRSAVLERPKGHGVLLTNLAKIGYVTGVSINCYRAVVDVAHPRCWKEVQTQVVQTLNVFLAKRGEHDSSERNRDWDLADVGDIGVADMGSFTVEAIQPGTDSKFRQFHSSLNLNNGGTQACGSLALAHDPIPSEYSLSVKLLKITGVRGVFVMEHGTEVSIYSSFLWSDVQPMILQTIKKHLEMRDAHENGETEDPQHKLRFSCSSERTGPNELLVRYSAKVHPGRYDRGKHGSKPGSLAYRLFEIDAVQTIHFDHFKARIELDKHVQCEALLARVESIIRDVLDRSSPKQEGTESDEAKADLDDTPHFVANHNAVEPSVVAISSEACFPTAVRSDGCHSCLGGLVLPDKEIHWGVSVVICSSCGEEHRAESPTFEEFLAYTAPFKP